MRKVYLILATLTDEDVDWLVRTGRVIRPAANDEVIRQGEPARDLFFVMEGSVIVSVAGVGEVARLQQGEIVGEMSFVDREPPSATVRCDEGVALLAIDRRDVADRLSRDLGFAARFYQAMAMFLSDRLRVANGSFGDDADELSEASLETLSIAGQRFDTMRRLALG